MRRFIMIKEIFKEHPIKIILAFVCILLFMGFKFWDTYAPLPIHNWNKQEISQIKVANPEDFTFAVFGDNKGNSSFFEPLLRDIDHDTEIAFAIDVGDLVSEGEKGRYRRFLNQVQENLTIPFLTAIGNHDLSNGSPRNYQEIFGSTYYAFRIGESYFFVLDATTESGFNETERNWLKNELQKAQASKARFIFMHVPAFDPRGNGFNKCLQDGKDLLDLFRRYNVTHLFASHIHGYFSGIWEGVSYTITGGAGAKLQGDDPEHFFHHYVKVHVKNGKVDTAVRRIDAENVMKSFIDLVEDFLLEWGLLAGAGISLLTLGLSIRRNYGLSFHYFKRIFKEK
jgi:3',5'-cyclic AMP phosphodiesterase CpdA